MLPVGLGCQFLIPLWVFSNGRRLIKYKTHTYLYILGYLKPLQVQKIFYMLIHLYMSSKYGMLKITNDKKESINSDDQQFHQCQQN
jgi:hypothetical protein